MLGFGGKTGRGRRLDRSFCAVLFLCFALSLASCASDQSAVSIGRPHLYSDDIVAQVMAQRQRAIADIAKGVTSDGVNERRRIREYQTTQSSSSLSTGGADPADLPAAPEAGFAEPVAGELSLPSATQLRKLISRDQDVLGYELLYLGDEESMAGDRHLVLLRMDVSINRTLATGTSVEFLQVLFDLSLKNASGVALPDDEVRVVALMPEVTSIVAEESLTNLALNNVTSSLSATAGDASVGSSSSRERGIEDSLLLLVERHTQYATLSTRSNQFGFAFGPRRTILRRSWINPARWFGSTFRPSYSIEPGMRDCYALISLPRGAAGGTLEIESFVASRAVSESAINMVLREFEEQLGAAAVPESFAVDGTDPSPYLPGNGRVSMTRLQKHSKRLPKAGPPPANSATPKYIFPSITSTLLVNTKHPVNAATRAQVGHVWIPEDKTEILGRHLLRLEVPADKGLVSQIGKDETGGAKQVTVRLYTPGRALTTIDTVELRKSDPDPKPPFTITPDKGVAGQVVVTIGGLKDVDLKTVSKVMLGSTEVPSTSFSAWEKDKLSFTVPLLPQGAQLDKVAVTLFYSDPKKPGDELRAFRANAFTYEAKSK